ncbi:MAG: type II toxin-antitoxin system HipA family toxin [Verrucomicrobiales bacterium]
MSNRLVALARNQKMGELVYDEKKDRITLHYDAEWVESDESFPLSISMPIVRKEHEDKVTRPFISGLLPDNNEVLDKWARKFQVSARNQFRLLYHVGEECAGGVQFVQPERAEEWIAGKAPQGIQWITREELEERVGELLKNHAAARRDGDRGQFSLAGAQPKMGLYRDDQTGQWGVPEGETPTTHILKPNEGSFADHDQNEHYCLTLARHLGMAAAESWIERIGEIPVIIVKRFDRMPLEGKIIRVHQEDTCQALGIPPLQKYERDGGPTAGDIFGLIRDYSSNPREDGLRFLDALIYNWLIKGTDAHGKNFGFLLAAGPQVRLAPLYDVASFIPYETPHQERKTRMAMKIGGEYEWWKIGPQHWERAAKEWKLDQDRVFARITDMAARMPGAVSATRVELESGGIGLSEGIARLEDGILKNSADIAKLLEQG